MRRVGTHNPVFMLDEIDKLGADFRGDPAAALLEVLDPEQNNAFSDHYLEVNFDLSSVIFIATANTLETIPPALLDRMEVLEIPGYTRTRSWRSPSGTWCPSKIAEHGLDERQINFDEESLTTIIEQYTREAGVRNLEREVANVIRAVAVKVAENEPYQPKLDPAQIAEFLGHRSSSPRLPSEPRFPGWPPAWPGCPPAETSCSSRRRKCRARAI